MQKIKTIQGAMSQKAALKKARLKVGTPYKSFHSWVMYVPWKCSDPNGPTTEVSCWTKNEVFQIRANYVASVALHFMDFTPEQIREGYSRIDYITYNSYPEFMNAETLLKEALWVITNFENERVPA